MLRSLIVGLILLASGVAVAQPDFATSHGAVTPAAPIAGDVARYAIAVTNSGAAAAYARITSTLPNAYFIAAEGDCAQAPGARASGELVWREGGLAAGETRRCTVTVLTRREAAGTIAGVTTEIRVPPSFYHRVEAAAELRSAPDPHAVRLGPVAATRAGLAVMALLAVYAAGVPVVLARARRRQAPARDRLLAPARMAFGAWTAVMIAAGFLVYFAALGYGDWRAYNDYRRADCTVFGSAVQIFESEQRAGSPRATPSYQPLFAVRYAVDGVATYSAGYASPSALNFNSTAAARSIFARFALGSSHPCWYDPQDPKTVLLVRGPGGAYVFALLPLPVLALGLFLLRGAPRRPADA